MLAIEAEPSTTMGKTAIVIFTILLVILTSLWFYGRGILANKPQFEGVGPEDAEERVREYYSRDPPPF